MGNASRATKEHAPKQGKALTRAEAEKPTLIGRMAAKASLDPTRYVATLRETVMPSKVAVSNEQLAAFLSVADHYELNPLIKEIFAFPGKGGGIVPVVSVDGWISLINRQPQNDGVAFDDELDEAGTSLIAVTCRIFRKDRSHPTEVTEYMVECRRDTDVWKKWPRRMLRHKALIQCARIAFGLSGIYDPDEAERMGATVGLSVDPPPAVPSAPPAPTAAPKDVEEAEIVDPETGEVEDPADAPPLGRFKAALAAAENEAQVNKVWDLFEPQMPKKGDPAFEAFADAYRTRVGEVPS